MGITGTGTSGIVSIGCEDCLRHRALGTGTSELGISEGRGAVGQDSLGTTIHWDRDALRRGSLGQGTWEWGFQNSNAETFGDKNPQGEGTNTV